MMGRRIRLGAAALGVGAIIGACAPEEPEAPRGGFEGDPRPTFQADDPYQAMSDVRWKSWSPDLFSGRSDTPILLDISGLWCHWCHVYDAVVYRDAEIAAFIEENFVPVRVDPDRRPDIDSRYHTGGWPSLAVLTPEGDVVAQSDYDPENLRTFLNQALEIYSTRGDTLRSRSADERERLMRAQPFLREAGSLDPSVLERVVAGIKPHFDLEYGGFASPGGDGTKVLAAGTLHDLLVEVGKNPVIGDDVARFLERSLLTIRDGAIHDPLFGGFFRTSGDRSWSLPHFEKVLSVQADAIDLYRRGHEVWPEAGHDRVVASTVDFVLDELGNPDGITFANAIDPDRGPGDDGATYTWTVAEVDSLLDARQAAVAKLAYGIAPRGEMPNNPVENTLMMAYPPDRGAPRLELDPTEYDRVFDEASARMRAYRRSQGMPRVDVTAYAAPNLRTAAAFLRAAGPLGRPELKERGIAVIDFFTDTHLKTDGLVPHGWNGQELLTEPAYLDNQVAALQALVTAHGVTGDDAYRARAVTLLAAVRTAFRNEVVGVYWDLPTTSMGPGLLALKRRPLEENVALASILMDLFVDTLDPTLKAEAELILSGFTSSFGSAGFRAIPYATAVHRLSWDLRGVES